MKEATRLEQKKLGPSVKTWDPPSDELLERTSAATWGAATPVFVVH